MERLRCLAWLTLLLAIARSTNSRVTDATVYRDERQTILINEAFGFSETGHLELNISNFQFFQEGKDAAKPNLDHLGFFINPTQSEGLLELDLAQGECGLLSKNALTLMTIGSMRKDQPGPKISFHSALSDMIKNFKGGEFALFFENCEPEGMVTFDIQVSLYNVGKNGNKDYLAVGEDLLPSLYMVAFVCFTIVGVLWAGVLMRSKETRHRVHYLMGVLVAFKTLTLLSQAGMYHLIRQHGHPSGWNVAFYTFTFLRGLLFFTVIVLVGTGWSYMKPLLADREKRILMIVIPLQVCAEVAIVILDEYTPATRSWFTWRDIFHVVDIVCCCAIIFPIVWSINHLRKASQTDGKAARSLAKLQLFQHFYVLVVSYIYFTRIVVYLMRSTLPYNDLWTASAAEEAGALIFYCLVGWKFRPQNDNPYFKLAQEEEIQMQEL